MTAWDGEHARGPQGLRRAVALADRLGRLDRPMTWALPVFGAAALLAGLAALPGAIGLAHILCVAGSLALLAGAGVRAASPPLRSSIDIARLDRLADRLEDRIEALEDVRWEISENEARYRDLLDAQADIILKLDGAGRLTFVNTAFCRAFAVAPEDVLGSPLTLPVIETLPAASHDPGHALSPGDRLECTATAEGPQWISWRAFALPVGEDGQIETEWVGRNVTAEREAAAALKRAQLDAESANRAKSRFLAAMSHEIRTPMNGILGMTSLLRGTEQTPEQQTYADAIDYSARTLLALIDEILDFSKIEAGKLSLENAPFSLADCVQSAVELMARRAHEKGLDIAWRVDPALPERLVGDAGRLRQVLLNLISNAIKFTDVGGVEISAEPARPQASYRSAGASVPTALVIRVRDTGIGLEPEAQVGVFAEFEQVDGSARREHGGTGLGLAISRRVVVAMGGTISVDSRLGAGSTFAVSLTLPAAAGAECDLGSLRNRTPPTGRVLITSDREIERRMIAQHLADAGIEAWHVSASGAAEAIATARAAHRPIDHLIVDTTLAPADAASLLQKARAVGGSPSTTGHVLIEPQARAGLSAYRAGGFEGYLLRPVRPGSLLRQLSGIGAEPATASRLLDACAAEPPSPGGGAFSTQNRPILVVEDNPINELLAVKVITNAGFACHAVRSGEAAVAHIRQAIAGTARLPSVILMDICMPGLDGVATTTAIRALFATDGVERGLDCPPIVALTAHAFAEDRARYLASGLDDYLAKPFEPGDLLRVVGKLTGARPDTLSAA